MLNIEPNAANAAKAMQEGAGEGGETLLRKATLILSEQGLFAFGLFLATRGEDIREAAKGVHRAANELLVTAGLAPEVEDPKQLTVDYYRRVVSSWAKETDAEALYRILLTQRILERALSYAVYYAKAS